MALGQKVLGHAAVVVSDQAAGSESAGEGPESRAVPHRIAYLDSLPLDWHPIACNQARASSVDLGPPLESEGARAREPASRPFRRKIAPPPDSTRSGPG
jgi:hypothetical protein